MQQSAPATRRAPSMRDVAQAAGVSVQTVSRVLNNKGNVSESTRSRVQDAIEKLNYHRNVAALSLVTSVSSLLGIVDFSRAHAGSRETVRAVQTTAYSKEYFVSIAHVENMSATSIRSVVGSMLQQSVAGLVLVAPHHEALATIADLNLAVPFVVVAPQTKLDFVSVSVDDQLATQTAIDHLLDLGHERLVHLSGPLDWVDATTKMESWYTSIQRSSLPVFPTYVGDWTAQSGYQNARRIVTETDATAIFAANDQMSLGVMCALQKMGIRIPEDVSVVGFGDVDESEFYYPPLTTIKESYFEAGRIAVELLLKMIQGLEPESVTLTPELVVRDSTGPAPSSSEAKRAALQAL